MGAVASTARQRDQGKSNMYIPTYEDMLAAHDRIMPHIRRTPSGHPIF